MSKGYELSICIESNEHCTVCCTPQGAAAKADAGAAGGKLWKKKNADGRVRREYKTASQLLAGAAGGAGGGGAAPPPVVQPILDMRGPQARIITNMEHLNVQVCVCVWGVCVWMQQDGWQNNCAHRLHR